MSLAIALRVGTPRKTPPTGPASAGPMITTTGADALMDAALPSLQSLERGAPQIPRGCRIATALRSEFNC